MEEESFEVMDGKIPTLDSPQDGEFKMGHPPKLPIKPFGLPHRLNRILA